MEWNVTWRRERRKMYYLEWLVKSHSKVISIEPRLKWGGRGNHRGSDERTFYAEETADSKGQWHEWAQCFGRIERRPGNEESGEERGMQSRLRDWLGMYCVQLCRSCWGVGVLLSPVEPLETIKQQINLALCFKKITLAGCLEKELWQEKSRNNPLKPRYETLVTWVRSA